MALLPAQSAAAESRTRDVGRLERRNQMQAESIQAPGALRLVVADDHPFYRRGVVRILADAGLEVVAEVSNGADAIHAAEELAPDVVVMDLNMPGLSGVEATRQLTERVPVSKVLMLTVSAEETDVFESLLAGANGYVLKDGPVEELIEAIRAVAAGQSLISPRIASMLLLRIREHALAERELPKVTLSARELEVLTLLAEGKANPEIGEELFISPSTVRNHISSILIKLHVGNRVQAAVRAVRGRII
jgi:DNA-binding NarL/FixJ family response regulator